MATQFWHGTRIKRHFSSWGAQAKARRSGRIDPEVAREARHSDYPDVSTYDRPATTRMTSANLTLSIVLLVSALVVFGVILWSVFR